MYYLPTYVCVIKRLLNVQGSYLYLDRKFKQLEKVKRNYYVGGGAMIIIIYLPIKKLPT